MPRFAFPTRQATQLEAHEHAGDFQMAVGVTRGPLGLVTERQISSQDEFPMPHIPVGDFSGLIDLWERGQYRKTLCRSR
jgi:hypothetical protein